jgi:hypothetical protein
LRGLEEVAPGYVPPPARSGIRLWDFEEVRKRSLVTWLRVLPGWFAGIACFTAYMGMLMVGPYDDEVIARVWWLLPLLWILAWLALFSALLAAEFWTTTATLGVFFYFAWKMNFWLPYAEYLSGWLRIGLVGEPLAAVGGFALVSAAMRWRLDGGCNPYDVWDNF